jgi:hypothetical protein
MLVTGINDEERATVPAGGRHRIGRAWMLAKRGDATVGCMALISSALGGLPVTAAPRQL